MLNNYFKIMKMNHIKSKENLNKNWITLLIQWILLVNQIGNQSKNCKEIEILVHIKNKNQSQLFIFIYRYLDKDKKKIFQKIKQKIIKMHII